MKLQFVLACCASLIASAAIAQESYRLRPYNEPATEQKSRPSPALRAPAPPLTSVSVYAVGSTQYGGWENTTGKFTTTGDHGGTQLRVAVVEWGYAHPGVARFNGTVLPSSANYQSESICGGSPSAPVGCSPGQTVVGWVQYYNLDGRGNSGNFQYQASSINAPFRTYSTSITIR